MKVIVRAINQGGKYPQVTQDRSFLSDKNESVIDIHIEADIIEAGNPNETISSLMKKARHILLETFKKKSGKDEYQKAIKKIESTFQYYENTKKILEEVLIKLQEEDLNKDL